MKNTDTEWVPLKYLQTTGNVLDYTGSFEISRKGDIRNLKTSNIIQYRTVMSSSLPYKSLQLPNKNTGIQHRIRLHRALLSSFYPLEPIFGFLEAAHIDGNNLNNDINNLCWMNKIHNVTQAFNEGDVVVDPCTRIGVFLKPIEEVLCDGS